MKNALLLSLSLLAGAGTTPIQAKVAIPTAVASWILGTGGIFMGVLATTSGITATELLISLVKHPEQKQADKDFTKGLACLGGATALGSGILSYFALKTAYNLIQ